MRKLLLFGAVLFLGCNNEKSLGPPQVKYGHAECAGCGMIVSNERYASAIVHTEGDADLIFDDINCMAEYEAEHPVPTDARRYVHDVNTDKWLSAAEAMFVRNPDVHTPMGSGLQAMAKGSSSTMPTFSYEQLCAEARTASTQATARQ